MRRVSQWTSRRVATVVACACTAASAVSSPTGLPPSAGLLQWQRRSVQNIPAGGRVFRPGDWHCKSCRVHNYRHNSKCFACSASRPTDVSLGKRKLATDDAPKAPNVAPLAPPPDIPFMQGDWNCQCGHHNYRSRIRCQLCGLPRPKKVD